MGLMLVWIYFNFKVIINEKELGIKLEIYFVEKFLYKDHRILIG